MKRKLWNIFCAIFVLVLCLWGGWHFLGYLKGTFSDLENADASVKAAVIGVFATVSLALYSQSRSRKREIASRLFEVKSKAYLRIIDLLYDLMRSAKTEEMLEEEELVERMMQFKKDLLIWGSSKVISAWNDYELMLKEGNDIDIKESSNRIEAVLKAIRNDLGHGDFLLKHGSLWGLFLDADAKKQIFGIEK